MHSLTKLLLLSATALSSGAYAGESVTFSPDRKEVSNWKAQAAVHLNVKPETLAKYESLRCVKLNNYWCLKDVGWVGVIGHDSDNHTAFSDGFFAARAAVRNFRTAYVISGRKSALGIMSVYAPPDDCIGSKGGMRPDGTCIKGKNPTEQYALTVSKGISTDINADLVLFDSQGHATDALVRFLIEMSVFELGIAPTEATVRRGICLEDARCQQ